MAWERLEHELGACDASTRSTSCCRPGAVLDVPGSVRPAWRDRQARIPHDAVRFLLILEDQQGWYAGDHGTGCRLPDASAAARDARRISTASANYDIIDDMQTREQ